MKLIDMTEKDMWNLMLDYYPNFYTGYELVPKELEEGGDEENGNDEKMDDDVS